MRESSYTLIEYSYRSYGLAVRTLDSESRSPSSNLGRTFFFFFPLTAKKKKNVLFSFFFFSFSYSKYSSLIEQFTNLPEYSTPDEIISSLKINEEEEEIEPFSTSELDEILQSFPINSDENVSSNLIVDFDFSNNNLIDSQTTINDDLFVQMLLDIDYSSPSSTTETTFDDLFFSDSSSSLPKITSVDEFDAFLRDFTRNLSSHQQEVSTPIS